MLRLDGRFRFILHGYDRGAARAEDCKQRKNSKKKPGTQF